MNAILALVIIGFCSCCSRNIITKKEAFEVFLSREKRYNRGVGEELVRPSNLERECVEEYCSKEEYLEAMENDYPDVRSCDKCHESYKNCLPESYSKYKRYSKKRRKRFANISKNDAIFAASTCLKKADFFLTSL